MCWCVYVWVFLVIRVLVFTVFCIVCTVFLYCFLYAYYSCGPGSSVGIATDYGLDGPGSNPGGDEIFRPSRPALGPTQPPLKWVPGTLPYLCILFLFVLSVLV